MHPESARCAGRSGAPSRGSSPSPRRGCCSPGARRARTGARRGALGELPVRFGQLAIESWVAIPWLGWAIAIPLLWSRFTAQDRAWLALAGAVVAAVFVLTPLSLSVTLLGALGLRYVCGLLPLAAGVSGLIVARASGGSRVALAAGIALFGLTHLPGSALPALWLRRERAARANRPPRERVARDRGEAREPRSRLLPARPRQARPGDGRGDRRVAPGPRAARRRAGHQLLLGQPLLRDAPAAGAVCRPGPRDTRRARAGLPAYVSGVDDADWVVWRHGLAPTPGTSFERVRQELEARGARLEQRGAFRETQWENRPELHWHRFPGVGYPYAPARLGRAGIRYPKAVAYRVVWP